MATSLSIKGKTQANDGVTSTINYVNPNATDAQLVSLATAFNNLTTNTVSDITRIDKNSLINTVEKLSRNVQLFAMDQTTPITEIKASAIGDFENAAFVFVRYNSDDYANDILSCLVPGGTDQNNVFIQIARGESTDNGAWILLTNNVTPTSAFTLTFAIAETSTYQAATFTIPVTL